MRLLAAGGDRMVTLPKKAGLPEERPAGRPHRKPRWRRPRSASQWPRATVKLGVGLVTSLPWKRRGSLAIAKDWLGTMLSKSNGVVEPRTLRCSLGNSADSSAVWGLCETSTWHRRRSYCDSIGGRFQFGGGPAAWRRCAKSSTKGFHSIRAARQCSVFTGQSTRWSRFRISSLEG